MSQFKLGGAHFITWRTPSFDCDYASLFSTTSCRDLRDSPTSYFTSRLIVLRTHDWFRVQHSSLKNVAPGSCDMNFFMNPTRTSRRAPKWKKRVNSWHVRRIILYVNSLRSQQLLLYVTVHIHNSIPETTPAVVDNGLSPALTTCHSQPYFVKFKGCSQRLGWFNHSMSTQQTTKYCWGQTCPLTVKARLARQDLFRLTCTIK